MKDLRIFIALLFLGVALFMAACKKHYAVPAKPVTKLNVKLINVGDAANASGFEYGIDGATSRITIVTDSNPTIYTVDYQNHIPAQLRSSSFNVKLTYSNGRLQQTDWYDNRFSEVQSRALFNYAGDQLSEEQFYEKFSNGLQPWMMYKFETLPNGDISKADIFLWDSNTGQYNLLGSNRYEYDDHPNPVYPLNDFYKLFTLPATPHNIVKETSYDSSGILVNLLTYNYTYNSNGYPAKAKRSSTPVGGYPTVTTLDYTYQ